MVQRGVVIIVFYEQLKNACSLKGISPTALTREFNMSSANTGKWKNGGTPSIDVLIKFADRLDVTTDYLLGRTDNPATTPLCDVNIEKEGKVLMSGVLRFAGLTSGKKVHAIRRELGWSKEEAAKILNLNVDNYEVLEKKNVIFQSELELDNQEHRSLTSLAKYAKVPKDVFLAKPKYLEENEIKKSALALAITRERKKLGDTQESLANELEVDVISVISWESGERIPNDYCAKLLQNYLGIDESLFKQATQIAANQ